MCPAVELMMEGVRLFTVKSPWECPPVDFGTDIVRLSMEKFSRVGPGTGVIIAEETEMENLLLCGLMFVCTAAVCCVFLFW